MDSLGRPARRRQRQPDLGRGRGRQLTEPPSDRGVGSLTQYGANNAAFFIFFTTNNYAPNSGCFDADCPGFVQTDTSVHLGDQWAQCSNSGGTQIDKFMGLFKNGVTGDWWVRYGTDKWLGYWPSGLFNFSGLQQVSNEFAYYGEIWDKTPGHHTRTHMGGDGSFASGWYQHAAYQRNLRYYYYADPHTYYWADSSNLVPTVEQPNCYTGDYRMSSDPYWHDYMFFGGPGYSASCP
jgi:hypothetical protein